MKILNIIIIICDKYHYLLAKVIKKFENNTKEKSIL